MKKPSVTELLKILDKPALLNWANKIGLEGIKLSEYRKNVQSDGLSLHKQIENYINDGTIPSDDTLKKKLPIFLKNKSNILIEQNIETDYFIGRYDIFYIEDGIKYVCDFKRHQKYIYNENKLQLVAYSMAKECDKMAIIGIPEMNIINFDCIDRAPYIKILKYLTYIYIAKNQLGWQ